MNIRKDGFNRAQLKTITKTQLSKIFINRNRITRSTASRSSSRLNTSKWFRNSCNKWWRLLRASHFNSALTLTVARSFRPSSACGGTWWSPIWGSNASCARSVGRTSLRISIWRSTWISIHKRNHTCVITRAAPSHSSRKLDFTITRERSTLNLARAKSFLYLVLQIVWLCPKMKVSNQISCGSLLFLKNWFKF